MTVLVPTTLRDALASLEDDPARLVLAGGTDLMVQVNEGTRHPERVLALVALTELRARTREGDTLVLGAGSTYTQLMEPDVAAAVPALAQAARTVGSPQIRNAGTIGGNLATASPAGDTLPVLAAVDAAVVLRSAAGERRLPFAEFMTGPKRNVRRHDELVIAAEWDD